MECQLVPLDRLGVGRRFRIPPNNNDDDVYTLLKLTEEPSLPIRYDDGGSWPHGINLYLGRTVLVEPYEDK